MRKSLATAILASAVIVPSLVFAGAADATLAQSNSDATSDTETNAEAAESEAESAEADPAEDAEDAEAEAGADQSAEDPTVVAKRGDRGGTVRELQSKLNAAGFNAGPADGIFGPRTQAAVSSFQAVVGLGATGVYDSVTAAKLASYTPHAQASQSSTSTQPAPMSVREAQRLLVDAGFNPGPIDGLYGRKTRAGLEAFQRHVSISVTGRIDQPTADTLRNFDGSAPANNITGSSGSGSGDGNSASTSLREAQRLLANGPFDPGPADGVYGTKTKNAIWALEKLVGIAMDGRWSSADQAALKRVMRGEVGGPTSTHNRRWVEIDLSQQLIKVYDPGRSVPILVSHVSSGSGVPWRQGRYSGRSITPVGSFTIFRRISGWRQSSLGIGSLYNPLYFTNSGIALHGSRSVPSYPASHGCVRVPMHIAEYLPSMLPNGTPVVVTP